MAALTERALVATPRLAELEEDLVRAVEDALPLAARSDDAVRSAERSYRTIAVVLVELRHEFTGGDGRPDLRGRSRGYREIVRRAYITAGAAEAGPIEKRITVGVAYWVRKLLVERHGEEHLKELGVLPAGSFASVAPRMLQAPAELDDPMRCLVAVVDLLNQLAADPDFEPAPDQVRSASRAVALLHRKLVESGSAA